MNNKPSQNMVPSDGGMLKEITLRVKLFLRLMADRRVSPLAKLIPVASFIYWVSPIDLIAGIPGLSAVDDVAILWFAQYMFLELCPPEVVRELSQNLVINSTIVEDVKKDAGTDQDEVVDGEATDVTNL